MRVFQKLTVVCVKTLVLYNLEFEHGGPVWLMYTAGRGWLQVYLSVLVGVTTCQAQDKIYIHFVRQSGSHLKKKKEFGTLFK